MTTGATQVALAPIDAPSRMSTPTGSQSCADFGRAVGVDRAREVVVGQHDGRADEDTGGELRGLVDERVVLDLAVVADLTPVPM